MYRDPADQRHARHALARGADGCQLALGHRPQQLENRMAVVAAVLVERHCVQGTTLTTGTCPNLTRRTSVRYDRVMRSRPYELQLPFDDGAVTWLARQRIDHLRGLGGVEPSELVRLARGFPSLRDI